MKTKDEDAPLLMYPGAAIKFLGIGRGTFYKVYQRDDFPKARVVLNRAMYLRTELEEWVKNIELKDMEE